VFSFLALAVGLGNPPATAAQELSDFLPVGEMAPDVQVTGATRYGVVSQSLKLSDFRGETVVLAFFFRARSGG
jgi:peroxiredoxin Q/BCP